MTRRKMRRPSGPRAVGRCPVDGCQFVTVEMAADAAARIMVRHLHDVHEAPGTDYDDAVRRFYGSE